MSRIRDIFLKYVYPDAYKAINVQYPNATDGDSVYVKDINVAASDNGGFSGTVTDYFDSLTSVNTDSSATNPKVITVAFNRSLQLRSVGFGCDDLAKSFSNIVIKALGSGGDVRYTKDLSSDSTKRNSYLVKLPPLAANGLTIEFHTADEVCLSNLIVFKSIDVNSRISAISELDDTVEDISSFRGALSVSQALVHRVGISEYFKRDAGVATTMSVAALAGALDITVTSAVGFIVGDVITLSTTTMVERSHFAILNIVGSVLSLARPIDSDLGIGTDVVVVDISLNNLGTQLAPISSIIKPPPYEKWQITRFLITMLDGTAMDDGRFGGGVPLGNGLVIRTVIDGVVTTNTHWNTNQDLKDDMFDVIYEPKAPAGQFGLGGRWTLTQSEFAADLNGANGDYLEVLNQDDLAVLIDFKIKAQGRLFGG